MHVIVYLPLQIPYYFIVSINNYTFSLHYNHKHLKEINKATQALQFCHSNF